MSNLANYQGNFVKFLETEYTQQQLNWSGKFERISLLDLDLTCNVAFFSCQSNRVTVEIKEEFLENFKIHQEREILTIKEVKPHFTGDFSQNTNYTGNNVTIINGTVFVDGQKRTGKGSSREKPLPIIKIHAPHKLNLTAHLCGKSILASKVIFSQAKIQISGSATIGIAAQEVAMKLSGQGHSYLVIRGGNLDLLLSGQGNITTKGDYQDINVEVSGMGKVTTNGNCRNYRALVSGMGQIDHHGFARHSSQKITGMGSINGI